MRRREWITRTALQIVVGCSLLAAPSASQAGIYPVYSCGGLAGGAQLAWEPYQHQNMSAYSICPSNPNSVGTGIVTKASSDGGAIGNLGGAFQMFYAPPGATLHSMSARVGMVRLDSHWSTGIVAYNDSFDAGILLPYGCYAWGPACYGSPLTFYGPVTIGLGGYKYVRAETRCGNPAGCATTYSGQIPGNRALFSMTDVVVNVQDYTAPSVVPASGSIYGGGWVRGQVSGTANLYDNVGIKTNRWKVDGAEFGRQDTACDYRLRRPCPDVPGAGISVNTTSLSDGAHTLRHEAIDAADNLGAHQRTIYVDNTAPARITSNVAGGEGWHTTNDFDVSWSTPPGQAAPITRAHYELCETGSSSGCTTGTRTGNGIQQISDLSAPRTGDYSLKVWLEDGAGNVNANAKSDPVRVKFDNVPPGQAAPDTLNGWLNAEEARDFPQRVQLGHNETEPISGIAGYSVTLDGSQPDATIEVEGKVATLLIDDLPEGVNTIKARAVSGAGVPSNDVGVTLVRVDKSPPDVSVSGAPNPNAWVRDGVNLRLAGTDQAGLSGMGAAANEEPIENGGHIRYRIDGGSLQRARGEAADVGVDADGKHTVTYQAVDVAGNSSTEKSIEFQVDKTPPSIAFDALDPADPLRLQVAVSDATSGIATGAMQMRASANAGGAWRTLESRLVGGYLIARIDDDAPDGTQEFRAIVRDVAGNQGTGDRRADGSKMEVRLPLRLGTRLGMSASARSVKKCARVKRNARSKKRKKKCKLGKALDKGGFTVAIGEARTIYGLLESVEGRLVERGTLEVLERVRPGGTYESVDTMQTDRSGRFAYKVRGGPSRTIRFAFTGSNLVKPVSAEAEILTPARTSIRTNHRRLRNGQSVTFSGKLAGRPIPKGGKVVEMQALSRGAWRAFATTRTDRDGNWTYKYRFRATTGLVRYRFRVAVRREDSYAYETGFSRKVAVTVKGP